MCNMKKATPSNFEHGKTFAWLNAKYTLLQKKLTKLSGFPGESPGSDSSPSIIKLQTPLLGLCPLQTHSQPRPMWEGRLIYWECPLGSQQWELHISPEDWRHIDTVSPRFNRVFCNKKLKTLVGRRSSDLEQAHREQKGKKDTQNFVGEQVQHTASMLHTFRLFLRSSPTFHFLIIPSQHWASRLLTRQVPCLSSLQSTPVISCQARLGLPACLPPVPGLPQR